MFHRRTQFDEYDLPAGSEQTQDAVREWLGKKRELAKHTKTVLGLLDPVRLGLVFERGVDAMLHECRRAR